MYKNTKKVREMNYLNPLLHNVNSKYQKPVPVIILILLCPSDLSGKTASFIHKKNRYYSCIRKYALYPLHTLEGLYYNKKIYYFEDNSSS